MKLPRRQFLRMAAGAAALPVISHTAWSQTYPTRPVRIVVASARPECKILLPIGQWLSEKFGRQFIIENRTGGGTNVATEAVVKAPPDGYTLLLIGPANAINATLYEKPNFVLLRDISPVASVASTPLVMTVHPSLPAHARFFP